MPRSGSGTYTLPSGNPVVTGTTIESNWANTTLSDIATTLTDSLSRSGQGGMTAALRVADGTQGAPGVGFANETGSGFYRAGTGEVWAVVQGAQTLNLDANGVTVPSDKATSIEGTFVFNETGVDKDARFEGDTDANLLFLDASTDRVGVGTSTPDAKLTVNGVGAFGAGAVGTPSISNTGDLNTGIWFPAADTVAVSTGGAEVARFDSSGNLGIGTSSPGERLTVAATANNAGRFTSTATTTALVLDNTNANGWGSNIAINTGGVAAGYFGTIGSLLGSTAQDLAVYANTGNGFRVYTNGNNERLRVDSSGNLGLGVTPSAWGSGYIGLQISSGGAVAASSAYSVFSHNYANVSGSDKYLINGSATRYYQGYGAHVWETAPSGTAGNTISFTQAMTLDASGNLKVNGVVDSFYTGTTAGSQLGSFRLYGTGAGVTGEAQVRAVLDTGSITAASLQFYTGTTEKARITSGGDLLVGTTTSSGLVTAEASGAGSAIGFFQNTAATPTARGLTVSFSNATGTNTSSADVFQVRTAGAERATIRGNGGFANYQANDANLSDERLKTDIQPAASYLDKICAIPVKTFLYKDQTDTERNLGVIAQDVDAFAPELVDRTGFGDPPEGESPYLAIYQTDLQYALMKCIQEQQALITALTARVAALEAQP